MMNTNTLREYTSLSVCLLKSVNIILKTVAQWETVRVPGLIPSIFSLFQFSVYFPHVHISCFIMSPICLCAVRSILLPTYC